MGLSPTAAFEGCLNVTGWQTVVARPDGISVTHEDECGRQHVETYGGLGAQIV
nr:peptide deformylase [Streptomyces antibioticus]